APGSHSLALGRTRHVLSDWDLDATPSPRAEVLRWSAAGFERMQPQAGPGRA
ncbi:MAG TPA: UDP-2,3-diacylglucosamine diphosphatase, partial [Caldimonas sp.]|nr:UDP-2,3-diacylglucosamine diphosphatase [Caldimonas sp.]